MGEKSKSFTVLLRQPVQLPVAAGQTAIVAIHNAARLCQNIEKRRPQKYRPTRTRRIQFFGGREWLERPEK
jgi:hypothetical protein